MNNKFLQSHSHNKLEKMNVKYASRPITPNEAIAPTYIPKTPTEEILVPISSLWIEGKGQIEILKKFP